MYRFHAFKKTGGDDGKDTYKMMVVDHAPHMKEVRCKHNLKFSLSFPNRLVYHDSIGEIIDESCRFGGDWYVCKDD